MATHSSILAWEIPWTEEPGGLSSWGRKESDTTEVTKHASVQLNVRETNNPIKKGQKT